MIHASTEIGMRTNATLDCFDTASRTNSENIEGDKKKSVTEKTGGNEKQVNNPYILNVGGIAVELDFNGEKEFSVALSNALCKT